MAILLWLTHNRNWRKATTNWEYKKRKREKQKKGKKCVMITTIYYLYLYTGDAQRASHTLTQIVSERCISIDRFPKLSKRNWMWGWMCWRTMQKAVRFEALGTKNTHLLTATKSCIRLIVLCRVWCAPSLWPCCYSRRMACFTLTPAQNR